MSSVPSAPPHSVPLPVDFQGFPGIKRLAAEYVANFDALRPFFAGDPADDGAWRAAIAARAQLGEDPPAVDGSSAPQQAPARPRRGLTPPRGSTIDGPSRW